MTGSVRPPTSAFVIATRNRPAYLVDTVQSILDQTVKPEQLCIVDASDEPTARTRLEAMCREASVPLHYVHPAPLGLPKQRNVGIDRTTADPVFFIDDDVLLEPHCHERVLEEYERRGDRVGGITAADVSALELPRLSVVWRKIFGSGGWWPNASGRLRAGFFPEGVSRADEPKEVEFFMGWFMSYRRAAMGSERFDEALSGYAYLEDIDFSYRVSRRYTLVWTPRARGRHLRATGERLSRKQLLRMMVANHFYLHRKNLPQTLRYKAALWWAFAGLLILNTTRAIRFRSTDHVTGLIEGLWDQLHGRGLVDPLEQQAR